MTETDLPLVFFPANMPLHPPEQKEDPCLPLLPNALLDGVSLLISFLCEGILFWGAFQGN